MKTQFETELESNILATIRELKADQVCGMGLSNLLQVTPTPRASDGPRGTNASWYYHETFKAVCKGNKTIMRFLI